MPSFADHIRSFVEHENQQGALLREALRKNRAQFYQGAKRERKRVSNAQAGALYAHNPYARALFYRYFSRELHRAVGAKGPNWLPDREVFLITIIDGRMVVPLSGSMHSRRHIRNPSIDGINRAYNQLLGFDYVAGLDVNFYISVIGHFRPHNYVGALHIHALVWNTDERALEILQRRVNGLIRPNIEYASAFHFTEIEPSDLARVAWYICRTPNRQYQLHRRDSGRVHQWISELCPKNRLRFLNLSHSHALQNYLQAGGEGHEVMKRTMRKLKALQGTLRAIPAKRDGGDPWPDDQNPELGRQKWSPDD